MKKLPKVNIIMATYNGEKYVRTQIDSILAQKDIDLTLNIYDDISKDSTMDILSEYAKKHKNIHVHQNKQNKNYTYNFLDALLSFKDCDDFEYYAFADQDDYWLPDKIITAINKIKEVGECTLYSSNLTLVDKDLKSLNKNMRKTNYVLCRHNEIYGNLITGCTAVFDNKFKNFVNKSYAPGILNHDTWIGLLANYGKGCNYILDNDPSHILYRQHGNNMVGCYTGNRFIHKIKKFFSGLNVNARNLRILLKYAKDELYEKDVEIIEKFLDYKKCKNKRFLIKNLQTSKPFQFRIMIFLNKFKFVE